MELVLEARKVLAVQGATRAELTVQGWPPWMWEEELWGCGLERVLGLKQTLGWAFGLESPLHSRSQRFHTH